MGRRTRPMICTICARGGSKGLPGKNVRLLLGLPLIAHSIRQALATGLFEAVGVSSDSPGILEAAKAHGATHCVVRPPELATDRAPKVPAIRHCVAAVEAALGHRCEVAVDLDATSPLRTPDDIRGAVDLLERRACANVLTGTPARRSPYFNLVEVEDGIVRLSKPLPTAVVRRQDAPACFDLNASIYVWRREALDRKDTVFLEDTALYVMPPERSVDIDSEHDFDVVELLARKRGAL